MQDLQRIMEKVTDVKYDIESLRCVMELLMTAYGELESEENQKTLHILLSVMNATDRQLSEILDMIDEKIMEEKQKEK